MATRLDVFFIFFFGFIIFGAIRSGLIKTGLDILSIFISIYLAAYYAGSICGSVNDGASFVYFFSIFFVVAYFIIGVIAYILHKLVKINFLGPIDIIGSLILGSCKAILLLGLIVWFVGMVPMPAQISEGTDHSLSKDWSIPPLSLSCQFLYANAISYLAIPKLKIEPSFLTQKTSEIKIENELPMVKDNIKKEIIHRLENNNQ